jgi:hypothetical protein
MILMMMAWGGNLLDRPLIALITTLEFQFELKLTKGSKIKLILMLQRAQTEAAGDGWKRLDQSMWSLIVWLEVCDPET